MKKLTEKQTEEMIVYWIDILQINDWNIAWSYHPMDDMASAYGRISWEMHSGNARIRLTDPKSFGTSTKYQDIEITIVHELVHLTTAGMCDKLEPIFTKQEDAIFVERPTDKLAFALVTLRKASNHKFSWEKKS